MAFLLPAPPAQHRLSVQQTARIASRLFSLHLIINNGHKLLALLRLSRHQTNKKLALRLLPPPPGFCCPPKVWFSVPMDRLARLLKAKPWKLYLGISLLPVVVGLLVSRPLSEHNPMLLGPFNAREVHHITIRGD